MEGEEGHGGAGVALASVIGRVIHSYHLQSLGLLESDFAPRLQVVVLHGEVLEFGPGILSGYR